MRLRALHAPVGSSCLRRMPTVVSLAVMTAKVGRTSVRQSIVGFPSDSGIVSIPVGTLCDA